MASKHYYDYRSKELRALSWKLFGKEYHLTTDKEMRKIKRELRKRRGWCRMNQKEIEKLTSKILLNLPTEK
jgi:hypothetical protein|tara:strand:+ start:695 stop:907 length:213 start_codon:yes stop_codon:yes gene_type:complete